MGVGQKEEHTMTAQELRQKYLEFFKSKGHTIIPSASLVPENDPTTLFTTAGMHPLVPYIMGEKHPGGKRVANVQKCVRTTDIDEVGDATHHTFFEMLGNWSFGDYFKKDSIEMSFEFLTSSEWMGLDKNRLAVSVFEGDENVSFDDESFEKWKALGISENKIAKLPKKNNWWGPAGETGPCGPDTEIFYWVGELDKIPESFADDNDQWVEIWNNVFMQFEKNKEGKFVPLAKKNVDTGMGMERILSALNGFDDNYKTELFWPIIEKIEELSGKKYEDFKKEFRIISDHIKAATFVISEGITPSNTDQGYVVRRLIRRAIRYGKMIGIENNFTKEIAKVVFEIYGEVYPEIISVKEIVFIELEKEENKFRQTLEKGLKEFNKLTLITGKDAFNLYQSYGFPLEMTEELAKEKNFAVNKKDFEDEFKKHQELSRTASAGKFKGGLADSGEETVKLHTVAHLLLAALREVLGEEIYQKGSNITAERLRFDFNYPEKLTAEQLKQVEDLVNRKIEEKIEVEMVEMPKNKALEKVKVSFDSSKYGDVVKVYSIGDFSAELCGGPHAGNTGELGHFKIKKEESSSAGVRRIKAVLE
ncbi:MAG: Alanine-tRNA ligase [Candidatus Moranbacteria bacterium GW2011_GWE2_35_2-]|nr:MAG: Alanine-tRNA ligase [Candidatus Moranbacteria bacterium GW2011_GWE2_35_2-]KKQ22883.1 MAG: Alanine-tRNA ligase [Candidatus Moranbacteria bacterium GW2011_GWF2_37_11]KKQ29241.1 MAG: Alanine-tRNA ligase [Candidatus Moranbacteria bacterium GW2011_GWD1_37_17]KKQ30886.1 MAG: Alanine-tRNA ligase [Candidatus Moranbacteria bacterium GW2011_GWE1_37_24]KKQ47324.1 MAG: Alanine-tRNA ligase [Candidatus Moranbacteria bacterium GW2011_GWD2_37_9]